jgi:hypothetical protein
MLLRKLRSVPQRKPPQVEAYLEEHLRSLKERQSLTISASRPRSLQVSHSLRTLQPTTRLRSKEPGIDAMFTIFGASLTNAATPTSTLPSVSSSTSAAQSTQDKASLAKGFQSSGSTAQQNPDTNSLSGISKTATSTSKHAPGTMFIPFKPFIEIEARDRGGWTAFVAFQHLCFQGAYANFSPEELRLGDYSKGRRGTVLKAN